MASSVSQIFPSATVNIRGELHQAVYGPVYLLLSYLARCDLGAGLVIANERQEARPVIIYSGEARSIDGRTEAKRGKHNGI